MELAYWHWVVLGVLLMLLEIFLPTFTALWFGAGAVIVGLIVLLFPGLSVAVQMTLWTAFSAVLTWAWFKYLKPLAIDRTKAGLSLEAIVGEVGQVITVPMENRRGMLRFPAPVLGSDEWSFISDQELAAGDRVRVTDVSGNSLMVTKV